MSKLLLSLILLFSISVVTAKNKKLTLEQKCDRANGSIIEDNGVIKCKCATTDAFFKPSKKNKCPTKKELELQKKELELQVVKETATKVANTLSKTAKNTKKYINDYLNKGKATNIKNCKQYNKGHTYMIGKGGCPDKCVKGFKKHLRLSNYCITPYLANKNSELKNFCEVYKAHGRKVSSKHWYGKQLCQCDNYKDSKEKYVSNVDQIDNRCVDKQISSDTKRAKKARVIDVADDDIIIEENVTSEK